MSRLILACAFYIAKNQLLKLTFAKMLLLLQKCMNAGCQESKHSIRIRMLDLVKLGTCFISNKCLTNEVDGQKSKTDQRE